MIHSQEVITLRYSKNRSRLDIRKYSFRQRTVDKWNDLPKSIVNASLVKCFEVRLDEYWKHQPIKYDYKHGLYEIVMNRYEAQQEQYENWQKMP